MTRTNEVRELIKSHGYTLTFIAQKLGISIQWLKKKLDNERDFTTTEITTLCELLEITKDKFGKGYLKERERLFFANDVG